MEIESDEEVELLFDADVGAGVNDRTLIVPSASLRSSRVLSQSPCQSPQLHDAKTSVGIMTPRLTS